MSDTSRGSADLRQLAGEQTSDFEHRLLRTEGESKVIEASANAGKESVHSKRICCFSMPMKLF